MLIFKEGNKYYVFKFCVIIVDGICGNIFLICFIMCVSFVLGLVLLIWVFCFGVVGWLVWVGVGNMVFDVSIFICFINFMMFFDE